ncbi:hypothetical protein HHX47_DHR1000793 [Lentinula edodes]|nr:hypothetical protein HHX47_DHR1000793 [Lentinula edodes]
MTRDHGHQDIKAEMSIEWLEELETSIGNIEAKAGIPKPSLYKDSVKKLASMLRNILVHIIIYEHDAAPESRRGEMLVHLGDRLKQFDQTVTKCERLKVETGIRKPREALLVSKFVGTPIFSLGKIYSAIGNKLKASLNKVLTIEEHYNPAVSAAVPSAHHHIIDDTDEYDYYPNSYSFPCPGRRFFV